MNYFNRSNAFKDRLGFEKSEDWRWPRRRRSGWPCRSVRERKRVRDRPRKGIVDAVWSASVAASGRNPPVRPLATHIISGTTPARSQAKHFARSGQKPVRTSSAMSSNVVGGSELADAREKLFGMNDHAARALKQRLHDDGGNFRGHVRQGGVQELSKAFDMAGRAREAHGTMRAVGGVRAQDWKSNRFKRRGERRIVADRHRPNGIAVIGVLERDDATLPGLAAIPPILNS